MAETLVPLCPGQWLHRFAGQRHPAAMHSRRSLGRTHSASLLTHLRLQAARIG
jgi:hypothetical protein